MKRSAWIIIGLIGSAALCLAADGYGQRSDPALPVPTVAAAADTSTVTLGDPITYTVTMNIPAGIEIAPEKPLSSGVEGFRIRDVKDNQRPDRAGNRVRTVTYILAGFELGKQTIPEYRIRYRAAGAADGQWTSLATKPVEITVTSVIADEKKAALQPLRPKLWIWPKWSGWLLIAALATAAAAVLWLKRRRQIQQVALVPAAEPAYVIALRELESLAQAHLPEQGLIEEFFERLSGCVRRYLENRFQLRAPWMSTEEFMEAAKASPSLNGQQKNSLKAFLVLSDLVKFARYGSSPKEADEAFSAARNFVEQTKDAPADPGNGAA